MTNPAENLLNNPLVVINLGLEKFAQALGKSLRIEVA